MEKIWRLVLGIILSCLLAGPVMAGGNDAVEMTPPAAQGEPQAGTVVKSGVSQIQQDIMNKREQARQRRDEMLKVRAQTIKAEEEQAKKQAGAQAK